MRKLYFVQLVCLFLLSACPWPLSWDPPPEKGLYFPVDMFQQGDTLYVVSYNKDRRYLGGSIVGLDLKKLDRQVTNTTNSTLSKTIFDGSNLVSTSTYIPSLSLKPKVFDTNEVFMLSRSDNQFLRVDLKGKKVTCGKDSALSVGIDCIFDSVVGDFLEQDPLYWTVTQKNDSNLQGIVGYKREAALEKLEDIQDTPLESFGELQAFTWNKLSFKLELADKFLLSDLIHEAGEKSSIYRQIADIGGLLQLDNRWVLAAATFISTNSSIFDQDLDSKLIWFKKGSLQQKPVDKKAFKQFSLTDAVSSQGVQAVASFYEPTGNLVFPGKNQHHVFVAMKQSPLLVHVVFEEKEGELSDPVVLGQRPICDRPQSITLSRSKKTLLVACGANNEILAYDAANLRLVGKDSKRDKPVGRAPVAIKFDERFEIRGVDQRFYVSYADEGTIGVFKLQESSNDRIRYVGKIFDPAPFNHPGGL